MNYIDPFEWTLIICYNTTPNVTQCPELAYKG